MKKNLIAISMATAFGAGATAAQAGALGFWEGTDATGVALVVPYYTVQNGNATLINIVNADSLRGKAVKVRFRGAQRSDDVFDFQVFLSPDDMWTANISQGADGRAFLTTNDNSCTLPSNVNQPFVTVRLSGTDAEKAAGTREGYVEIINMGDIVQSSTTTGVYGQRNALYEATKHVNGVAPCTPNILESVVSGSTAVLNADNDENGAAARLDLYATGGLFANVTIINVQEASAWSIPAEPVIGNFFLFGPMGVETRYWSQTARPFLGARENVTLDGLFLSGAVTPAQYDFPDLSTPRAMSASPPEWYYFVSIFGVGMPTEIGNEYITDDSIFAETDWVITLPTRRYAVEGRPYTGGTVNSEASFLDSANSGRGILEPFASVYNPGTGCLNVNSFQVYDREETTTTTGVVISPGDITQLTLCGEVAVVSFNRLGATTSGALRAELTLNDATVPYSDGWARMSILTEFYGEGPYGQFGLPLIAHSFVKANNGGSGAANMNFGGNWKHRTVGGITPFIL